MTRGRAGTVLDRALPDWEWSALDFECDPVTGFRDASPAGTVKVAMNFLYRDGMLSTETRCRATDRFSARAFGAYWLLIRTGSGIIRRSWLKGIARVLRNSDEGTGT